jgi:hypothetical protein
LRHQAGEFAPTPSFVLFNQAGFCAVATKYHAGQLNAQLGIHGPVPFHVGIVNAVMVKARTIADLSLI